MSNNSELKCRNCGSKYIQNKTLQLCGDCVFRRSHKGKNRQEVAIEKQKSKPFKEYKPIQNKKTYLYKRKNTGEKELFLEIWTEREHICINCKRHLGDTPYNWMFSHKVAKGVNKDFRLDKDNIELLCRDCHYAWEFRGKDEYQKRYREHGHI